MATNKYFTLLVLFFSAFIQNAQTPAKYWVRLKDKNNSPYSISNPSAFLSAKSIQRRTNQNISVDLTDLPINPSYINQITATGAQVFEKSKWFNAAIVIVNNSAQLTAVNNLTCVISSSPIAMKQIQDSRSRIPNLITETQKTGICNIQSNTCYEGTQKNAVSTNYNYGPSLTQAAQIGVDCMHDLGFRGNNITIAVIDDGFNQADTNPVFDSLRNEGRLLGTRDFIIGDNSVYEDDTHGAYVLSTISGNSPGNLIGTAPKAKMWLLRSEDATSEKIIEEYTWVIAAEFADSVGADITTTSLGYNTFNVSADNHTYADLDGKTAVMSKASSMAVRKGMFVLNAAGNEGNNSWQKILVPGDADSICTVGSVNGSGVHSSFSGIGPTADGRIKPDLSSMGEGSYLCGPNNNFFSGNGTSFAAPILAGAIACLLQANPTSKPMDLLLALKATSSQSVTPDNNYGWGIPNICAANQYLKLVGLNEKSVVKKISFFPNPTEQELNFTLTEDIENLIITNVLGQFISFDLLKTSLNNYTVKFDKSISNGVYSVSIKTSKSLFYSKFIKQ